MFFAPFASFFYRLMIQIKIDSTIEIKMHVTIGK